MKNIVFLLFFIGIYLHTANSIYFLLTEGKEKCIYDDIPDDEDIKLEYQLMDVYQAAAHSSMVELKIYDPSKQIMKEIQIRDSRKQTFAFIASQVGSYKFCFKLPTERQDKTKQVRFQIRLTVGESEEIIDGAKSGDFADLKEKAKKLDHKCQNYIKVQDMNREAEDKLYEVFLFFFLFFKKGK